MINNCFVGFLVCIQTCAPIFADLPVIYPSASDAMIVNVTNPPDGLAAAIPNDGIDDTSAINAILSKYNGMSLNAITPEVPTASRVVYFPEGTYNISDTLIPLMPDGLPSTSVAISGAGMGRTIFKLKDNANGFNDTTHPKPLIFQGKRYADGDPMGSGPCSAIGNLVRNLSINLGNNPGAAGIFVLLANMGEIYNVSISATHAFAGLITYDRAGTGLIKNVSIDGCNYGIYQLWDNTNHYYLPFPEESLNDGLVFEHITISNYKISAIYNYGRHYIMRDALLSSTNATGPAIVLGHYMQNPAQYEAYDLQIAGTPTKPGIKLLSDQIFMFLRDAKITDCSVPIDLYTGTDITQTTIDQFSSLSTQSKYRPGSELTLRLPVKEVPVYLPGTADWTKTSMRTSYDSTNNKIALQNDVNNCTTPVLYIPYGQYSLTGTINVSNAALRMIKGFFPYMVGSPQIKISDANTCMNIEDIVFSVNHQIIQDMSKPLVLKNIGVGPKIKNSSVATGDIFIENIGAHPQISVSNNIHMYIRQLNREHMGLTNDGAIIWCLGDNIESMGDPCTMPWTTKNGGISEILGAQFDAETSAANYYNATNYVYQIDGESSRLSVLGSGTFATNLNHGWDLLITDNLGEKYQTTGTNRDYLIFNYPNNAWGRMILPPYVVDRRNLAFYPMSDGVNNTDYSLYHISTMTPSRIAQRSNFGFLYKTFTNALSRNGVSKNINAVYLEDNNLALNNFKTNYCDFSVAPQAGYTMNISGISFDYAGENNGYGSTYTMRFYLTTDDTTPQTLGYAEMVVTNNAFTDWKTCWVDLGSNTNFQNLTTSKTFRMYFTANVVHWKCIGYFDNVAVHGTCDERLVDFDFTSSLEPVYQDPQTTGQTLYEGRLRHVNDLGLALQDGMARLLASRTQNTISNSIAADQYLVFDIQPSSSSSMNLKKLMFDMKMAQLGSFGPITYTVSVQSSVKGFDAYKTIAEFTEIFSDTNAVKSKVIDLDYPEYQNLQGEVSFRLYIADDQAGYLYRPSIDNLKVRGVTK
ncbi:MAG: hypothetical protein HOO88_05615 [Kiritimatiellaceae bacterium]|nr:hypothetical protein [Kiritimatiellaceae bacterium]